MIYACLGVAEIRSVFNRRVKIWLINNRVCSEVENSHALPFLNVEALHEFLTLGLVEGERKAAKKFREWVLQNLSENFRIHVISVVYSLSLTILPSHPTIHLFQIAQRQAKKHQMPGTSRAKSGLPLLCLMPENA